MKKLLCALLALSVFNCSMNKSSNLPSASDWEAVKYQLQTDYGLPSEVKLLTDYYPAGWIQARVEYVNQTFDNAVPPNLTFDETLIKSIYLTIDLENNNKIASVRLAGNVYGLAGSPPVQQPINAGQSVWPRLPAGSPKHSFMLRTDLAESIEWLKTNSSS